MKTLGQKNAIFNIRPERKSYQRRRQIQTSIPQRIKPSLPRRNTLEKHKQQNQYTKRPHSFPSQYYRRILFHTFRSFSLKERHHYFSLEHQTRDKTADPTQTQVETGHTSTVYDLSDQLLRASFRLCELALPTGFDIGRPVLDFEFCLIFAHAYTRPLMNPTKMALTLPKVTGVSKKTRPEIAMGSLLRAPTIE